jgi:[ribosomal protein S5]-alanine N-acetyltransferase
MSAGVDVATPRLFLRKFTLADVEDFYRLGSDPEIIRYTGDPGGGFKSIEEAEAVLRSHPLADYKKHGYGRWASVDRGSGRVIGFAGLKYLEEHDEIDLGYRFIPEYWGQGLATEAARASLAYGFDELHLEQMIGLVFPENTASIRVLEKIGMERQGLSEYFGHEVLKFLARRDRPAS